MMSKRWIEATVVGALAQRSAADRSGTRALPRHLVGQRCVAPLGARDGGLVVFTQVSGIERKLLEDAGTIEHELLVDVRGTVTEQALQGMRPARVSIGSERDGLVTARRSGREVRYAVREERLDQARAALARTAARWDTRLTAIKKLAEQAAKSGADR